MLIFRSKLIAFLVGILMGPGIQNLNFLQLNHLSGVNIHNGLPLETIKNVEAVHCVSIGQWTLDMPDVPNRRTSVI